MECVPDEILGDPEQRGSPADGPCSKKVRRMVFPHSERSALEEPFGLAGRTGRDTLSLATQGNAGLDEASDMKLRQLKAYSVPRLGRAGDVAAAVAWLTSDNGSWVTGQTIPINGGYAAS